MTFGLLALICTVALVGPLLSLNRLFSVPVVIGELAIGVLIGATGLRWVDGSDPTLSFMGQIGFALVMFVAGSHVPARNPALIAGLRSGALRAVGVGVAAVPAGHALAAAFGTAHGWLYAVLLASSSAALVLPAVGASHLTGPHGLELVAQIAVADAACIVALPLALEPHRAMVAAGGAAAVIALAAVFYGFLNWVEATGRRRAVHDVSEDRGLAVELRVVLLMTFALSAVAVALHVSVMLAGFAMGLVVAAVGQPRRIANQMLALTEGFFGPLFFVWLGSSLDLRPVLHDPGAVALGLALGGTALALHALGALTRQPWPLAAGTAAQLGVPVAAVALGSERGVLTPAEPAALLLGAAVTITAVTVLARRMQAAASAG